MKTIERILIAASLTAGRDAAFTRGLSLARESGAELYVLHAVPGNYPFSARAAERLELRREMQRRAERAGVAFHAVEQHGDPAAIIALHADARDADLIVMGADPAPRSGWLRRASIAERVLRRTARPTLIVAADDDAQAPYSNVLVAVDLSESSAVLVADALRLARGESRRLTLVHAVRSIEAASAVQSPARWAVPEYRRHVLDDAQSELEQLLARVPADVDAHLHIATGAPARAIVQRADRTRADLVVVGSSRRLRPLGSTAQRVLGQGTRALLVIPVTDGIRSADVSEEERRAA